MNADVTIDRGVGQTLLTDSATSATSAAAQVIDGDYTVRSAANDSGHIAASASYISFGGPDSRVTATSSWTETFNATAGSSAVFDFFIAGAEVGFEANNVSDLTGGYLIEILFNGNVLFESGADVITIGGTPQAETDLFLNQYGTFLSATFDTGIAPTFGLTGGGYRFGSFDGSLNLNPIDGVNTLTYRMSAYVDGFLGETSALAAVADPFNLSQDPTNGATLTFNSVPQVPVPAAVWLFSSGFLTLASIARRKTDL